MNGTPFAPTTFTNGAFDRNESAPDGQVVPPGETVLMPGATLRDAFAMAVVQGMFASDPDDCLRRPA